MEAGGVFEGMTVVITGTLPSMSRDHATALIEAAGGRVTSSVSKATSFLVLDPIRDRSWKGSGTGHSGSSTKQSCYVDWERADAR